MGRRWLFVRDRIEAALAPDDDAGVWLPAATNGHGGPGRRSRSLHRRVPITRTQDVEVVSAVMPLRALIGAPACEVALVELDAIVGWEFRPRTGRLEPGWAHGSVAVDPAIETRSLDHRTDDDNRRRHCGIYAVCDWLAGSDVQWLYGIDEDNAYYSHDYGYYLTGPDWTEASLAAGRDSPYTLSIPPDQLDAAEVTRLADALDALTRQDIEGKLSKLPRDWPVGDNELDAVADFVHYRRGPVGARLQAVVA